MIDRNIPYMPVMMIRKHASSYPARKLPEGYSFDFYSPETGMQDWIRVQLTSKQQENPQGLETLFEREFMDRPDWLPKRMLFVRDAHGDAVATATLWYGAPFGTEMGRIHWVATDERHQGRGLCGAILSKLMQQYDELGAKGDIYLISQTFSYVAIHIYQRFGFTRYMGPEPEGWRVNAFEETAARAWALIDEKLGEWN